MAKKFFGIRLEQDTLDKLEEYARDEGLLTSEYVRKLINDDIKRKEKYHFDMITSIGASEYINMIKYLLKNKKENDILLYSKSCDNYFLWNVGKSPEDLTHEQIIEFTKKYFMLLEDFISDIRYKHEKDNYVLNITFKNSAFTAWHGADIIHFLKKTEKFKIGDHKLVERNLVLILHPK
jgi:hypothetical protein